MARVSPACVLATVRVVRVTGSVPARATGMAPAAISTEVDIAAEMGGRYWDRTSDLLGVNEALSR